MRKLISVALAILLALPAWGQTKNSSQDVARYLDQGGNFYLYLSAEEWVSGLAGQIAQYRDLAAALSGNSQGDTQSTAGALDLVSNFVKRSGVEDISGFGMSSTEVASGLYRSKWILHHYPGKNSGYLWSAFGREPHALDALDLLPANTVFAWFSDVDLSLLWSAFNDQAGQSGLTAARQANETVRGFTAMAGADLSAVMASLDHEIGLALTIDQGNSAVFNLGPNGALSQTPTVGFMFICKVKNDVLFNLIDSALSGMPRLNRTDRAGLRMRTIVSPSTAPGSQRTSYARSGDYLFVASSDALIEQAVAVKAGQRTGLKSTDEFMTLSQGTPAQGNSFMFRSRRMAATIAGLQSQSAGTLAPPQAEMLKNLFGGASAGAFHVASNTPEGWVSVGYSGQNPATTLLMGPSIAVAVLTAAAAARTHPAQTLPRTPAPPQ